MKLYTEVQLSSQTILDTVNSVYFHTPREGHNVKLSFEKYRLHQARDEMVISTHNVEEGDGITLTLVHGGVVSGLFLPTSVEIVGHQVEDIQTPGNPGYIISGINDGLASRDSSTELESMGLEGSLEFSAPVSKGFLLPLLSSLAVSLPALRVLPIQVKTVKSVFQKEGNNVVDESFSEGENCKDLLEMKLNNNFLFQPLTV